MEFQQQSTNNNKPTTTVTAGSASLFAGCVRELVSIAQGSGYIASLASGTLGALVQSDIVRAAVLEGIGTRPIRTDAALPGMPLCLVRKIS